MNTVERETSALDALLEHGRPANLETALKELEVQLNQALTGGAGLDAIAAKAARLRQQKNSFGSDHFEQNCELYLQVSETRLLPAEIAARALKLFIKAVHEAQHRERIMMDLFTHLDNQTRTVELNKSDKEAWTQTSKKQVALNQRLRQSYIDSIGRYPKLFINSVATWDKIEDK